MRMTGFALLGEHSLPVVEIATKDSAADRPVDIEPLLRVCCQMAIAVIPEVDQEMRPRGTPEYGGDEWYAPGTGPDKYSAVKAMLRIRSHSGDNGVWGNPPWLRQYSAGGRCVVVWPSMEEVPPRQQSTEPFSMLDGVDHHDDSWLRTERRQTLVVLKKQIVCPE